MGKYMFDQFSYLHFASGIIAYFWNIKLKYWFAIHTAFEIIENTEMGIDFINNKFSFWPGGKPEADSYSNILGDTISTLIGWMSAYYIDTIGSKLKLYKKHIN